MGCGYFRIIAEYPQFVRHIAGRVLAWAREDAHLIETNSNGRNMSIVIPGSIMATKGALRLIDEGPNILSAYHVGRTQATSAGPGDVASLTLDGGPSILHLHADDGQTLGVHVSTPNTATIDWGDGTTTTGVVDGDDYEHNYGSDGHTFLVVLTDQTTGLTSEVYVVPIISCYDPTTPNPDPGTAPALTGVSPTSISAHSVEVLILSGSFEINAVDGIQFTDQATGAILEAVAFTPHNPGEVAVSTPPLSVGTWIPALHAPGYAWTVCSCTVDAVDTAIHVTSFSPTTATRGTSLTISGDGFNSPNKVYLLGPSNDTYRLTITGSQTPTELHAQVSTQVPAGQYWVGVNIQGSAATIYSESLLTVTG